MDDSKNRDDPESREIGDEAAPVDHTAEVPATRPPRRFPSSNIPRPRIEGVEAGVAAGLVPSTGSPAGGRQVPAGTPRHLAPGEQLEGEPLPDEIVQGVELPDWSDPPTREVPRILLRPGDPIGPVIPGPVWRESEQDFEQDRDAFAEIVSGSVPVVEHALAGGEDDLGFEELAHVGAPEARAAGRLVVPDEPPPRVGSDAGMPTATAKRADAASQPVPPERTVPLPAGAAVSFAGRVARSGGTVVHERPVLGGREREPRRHGRDPVVATVTGVVIGGVALLCFWSGPAAALAMASLVLLLAAAECFSALRKAHYQPATLLGLLAAPGFAIAAYLKGPDAIPIVGAVAVVATLCWYLAGVTRRSVVANMSVTLLAIGWIALLGSFAGLLLDPSAFPSHHGVAYLLGAAEVAVAYDVGGYAVGSWLGRHKLAPRVSPNKTWEGLAGGSLAAIVIALGVTSQMHPWTLQRAAVLGIAAAVLAPLGDLAESIIKRDLNVKDMGRLLPAHGGLLDRVDAILFVLPATYFIVRLFHG